MYQVDIFDRDGAILTRATFSSWIQAMTWMVAHRTGVITDSLGKRVKGPVEWELTRV